MSDKGISVFFTPEKFEAAIDRHGQYLRWYTSTVCYCMKNGSPDPNCNICLGRGEIFSSVESVQKTMKVFSWGGTTLKTNKNLKDVFRVYTKIKDYTVDSFTTSGDIVLTEAIEKGAYIRVDYEESLKFEYSGSCTYEGNGLMRANIPTISNEQGVFTGAISNITTLRNTTKDRDINYVSFWEDLIYTEDVVEEGDVIQIVCNYVNPVKLLIVNNNFRTPKDGPGPFPEADATVTFPGSFTVGKGDIFTQLKAEQRISFVGKFGYDNKYETPFFHIKRIISIVDDIGKIEDFEIVENNKIIFPSRKPHGNFSVSLTYYPTYMVSDLPRLRYAENKTFPKVAPLKIYHRASTSEYRPIRSNIVEKEYL